MKKRLKTKNGLITDKKGLIFLAVFNSFCTLMGIGSAVIYGELINYVSRGAENTDPAMLGIYIAAAAVYSVLQALLWWYSNFRQELLFNKLNYTARNKFLRNVLGSKYEDISSEDSSKYINTVTNDIPHSVGTYYGNMIWLISSAVMSVGSFVTAAVVQWKIAVKLLPLTIMLPSESMLSRIAKI
jgi:ABC-type multidrug transport system fused ATPase/permease subunit